MSSNEPDGEHHELTRHEKEGFETADSLEEAHDILDELEHGETILKGVMQGDGLLGGSIQTIRRYPHNDRLQVETEMIGRVSWHEADEVASNIHEAQLPIRAVGWEDRFE